jgi:hypothetical protein
MIFKNFLLKTGIFVNKISNKSRISKTSRSKILLKMNAIILKIKKSPNLVKGCNLAIKESVGIYEKKVLDKVEVEIYHTLSNEYLLS